MKRLKSLSTNFTYRIFYPIFFISGASSLAYEIIWIKIFIPIFGIGLYSFSAVVSAFMGGLALGGYICGKVIDKKNNLLRYYAFFEFSIGIYAVILPFLIRINQVTIPFFYNNISSNFGIFSIFRFLVAFFLLIIPCSLMGATLPLMSRFFILSSREDIGKGFSLLYALNVLGAVCGCAVTSFFLLYNLGVIKTSYIFAATNIIIGLFTFIYSLKFQFDAGSDFPGLPDIQKKEKLCECHFAPYAILIAVFLAGFCVLSFELLWGRILANLLPNDVYLFSILLVTILAGNSCGYFFASTWVTKVRNRPGVTGALMVLGGITIALLLRYIPFLSGFSKWYIWIVCPLIVFPPSFIVGMVFPNLLALYSSGTSNVGHDVGHIYSCNTVGAMLGSFATAFILIPFLGLRGSLFYTLLVYVLTGALIALAAYKRKRRKLILIFLSVFSSVLLFDALIPKDLFKNILIKHGGHENEELLFYKEGVISSLGLFKTDKFYKMSYPGHLFLAAEILPDGSRRRNHRLKAHIPMILHKNPATVLNIGFGTGISAHSLTLYDNIEKIDNVEIIAETMDVTHFFIDDPASIFKNPKMSIIIDDGRDFLFVTKKKFDIILVYPYSPLFTEAIYLYTKEFFQLCKSRLNKGGLVSVFFPVRAGNDAAPILARTFLEVFPNATLWNNHVGVSFYGAKAGGFLVGAVDKEDYNLSPDYLGKKMASLDKKVKFELWQSNIYNARDLLKHCMADSGSLMEFAGQAKEIVSDDRTILDYRAAEKRWSRISGDSQPVPQ